MNACLGALLLLAAQEPPSYGPVHALFAKHCASCHDAAKAEGDFVVDTHAAVMKGSADGPVVIPGKPDESLLLASLEHKKKPFMPPPKKAPKLKAEDIALVRAWIAAGAPGPRAGEVLGAAVAIPKIAPKKEPRKAVHAAAAEPRQNLLALARSRDVELRSSDTRAIVRTLSGHQGRVNAVAFSPDGALLLAGAGEPGSAAEARLWNVADGKLLKTFQGHADAVYAVAFAPDGVHFASGSYDQHVLLWNRDQAKPVRRIEGHNEAVYALGFRADGKILASASSDRTAKLWSVADGARLDTLAESTKGLHTLAWSPDGRRLATGGLDKRIRVYEISEAAKEGTNPLLHSTFAHEGAILRLAWSPDGALIASSSEDRSVKLWNAGDMTPKLALEVQPDWPVGLAFASGGKSLAVGRLDGSFQVYETAAGKPQAAAAPAPAKPELSGLEPRGLQRGTTSKLKLTGRNLAALSELRVHGGKAEAVLEGVPAADHVWIKVTLPEASAGELEFSLAKAGTETNRVKAFIEALPQIAEHEGGVTSAPLPASFWGVLSGRGDEDRFTFEAKAGETLVLDAAAKRLGSKAELVLSLLDATGRVIASNIDFEGESDPLLVAKIPADGTYTATLRDLQLGASADHWYRLSAGALPVLGAVFPLSVPAGVETELQLIGPNLPAGSRVKVIAGASGEVAVPADAARFRARRVFTVKVAAAPEVIEAEDNDRPAQAQPVSAPGGANGRFQNPGDVDHYRFSAKAGQTWVLETQAAQLGLPTDTALELLHPDGRPVERVLLRAVRDSYLTFRPIDSTGNGGRFWQWEEMDLGQYLYLQGEVVKLLLAPRGPDSTWDFFTIGGKRRTYFDTSATAHALDEPAYIVEPLPPGTKPPANGLPVFPVHHRNDDDADRRLGSDSKLLFKVPADGDYVVRVTESRGAGGERHLYRLILREARPDFRATLEGVVPSVPLGSGTNFSVRIDRIDGFEEAVRVDISGLPAGFRVSTPIIVEEGHTEAKGTLFAAADATKPSAEDGARVKVVAGAGGRKVDVKGFGTLDVAKRPRTLVWLEPDEPGAGDEIVLKPGGRVTAKLRIHREGHNDRVSFDLENLPFGSVVDDIGLSGILIPEGQTERRIFLNCTAWVAPMTRPAHARVREAPNPTSAPITVRVPARN